MFKSPFDFSRFSPLDSPMACDQELDITANERHATQINFNEPGATQIISHRQLTCPSPTIFKHNVVHTFPACLLVILSS